MTVVGEGVLGQWLPTAAGLFPSFWKPRRDASSDGIRTPGTLAVIHFVIGSLTDSQSISVTTVAGKGRRGHDNRVFLLCQDSECAWSTT